MKLYVEYINNFDSSLAKLQDVMNTTQGAAFFQVYIPHYRT